MTIAKTYKVIYGKNHTTVYLGVGRPLDDFPDIEYFVEIGVLKADEGKTLSRDGQIIGRFLYLDGMSQDGIIEVDEPVVEEEIEDTENG